jgi:hypothetical protein
LEGLKRLINEAAAKRRGLLAQLAADVAARNAAWRSLERARRLPLRPFSRKRLPTLHEAFEARRAEVERRAAEHDASHVQVDFAFGSEALDAFRALTVAHHRLSRSRKIWDVTSSVAIDRVAHRSTASTVLTRAPASLVVANSGIVASRWAGLGFGNANGEDLELFPGFCLVCDRKAGGRDFAIVDLRDLHLEATSFRFIEDEEVPSDSEVVGHAWEKANKDGSRDRRFVSNRQIPIARYGRITVRSPGGIHEAWMFSDHDAAQEFGACYQRLQQALANLARQAATAGEASDLPFAASEPVSRYIVPPLPRIGGAHEYTVGAVTLLGAAIWFGSAHIGANPFLPPGAYFPPPLSATASSQASAPMTASAPMRFLAATQVVIPGGAPNRLQASLEERVVTKQGANVRADASGSAVVLRTVSQGTILQVHSRRNGWVNVGDASPWGWIHTSLLEVAR